MDLKCWKNGRLESCDLPEFIQSLRRYSGWADQEFGIRSDAAAHLGERLNAAADALATVFEWRTRGPMTPKEQYEARRAPIKDQRMAEETAYAARMKKEAAADECFTTMLDGLKAFFDGHATLHIAPNLQGTGQFVRFMKDRPPQS